VPPPARAHSVPEKSTPRTEHIVQIYITLSYSKVFNKEDVNFIIEHKELRWKTTEAITTTTVAMRPLLLQQQ
jgi:hypothetical protein